MPTIAHQLARPAILLACLGLPLAAGCLAEAPDPAARLAISADWLNDSLSFLDADALVAPGGNLDSALIEHIDLAPYGQAPLSLDLTDDGTLAVVLLSRGVMSFVGARLGIETDQPASDRSRGAHPRCRDATGRRTLPH